MRFWLGSDRFQWGVNIDDLWKYANLSVPKSVIIPYIASVRLRERQFRFPLAVRGSDADSDFAPDGCSSSSSSSGCSPGKPCLAGQLAAFLKKHRVTFVRCWFQWNFFQPRILSHDGIGTPSLARLPTSGSSPSSSPEYMFPLDHFVSMMSDAGIDIVAVIGNGYSRFLPLGLQTDHIGEYLRKLTESSREIVRHYKDKVKVWQIENEPNWWRAHYSSQWRRGVIWLSAKNQEPILKALRDVVRSESPESTIVVNLMADDRGAAWKLYAKYSDILGLDFYPNYIRSAPINAARLSTISTQVKRETGLPILITETGYPTGPRLMGFDEENQRTFVRSACGHAFGSDDVIGLGWFRFSDSYWKSFPFQENHFGLLTKEGVPKPGWVEYSRLIQSNHGG